MSDQPAPEYTPRPSTSGTGATVAVILLANLLCGVGLFGYRFFRPVPMIVPATKAAPTTLPGATVIPPPTQSRVAARLA